MGNTCSYYNTDKDSTLDFDAPMPRIAENTMTEEEAVCKIQSRFKGNKAREEVASRSGFSTKKHKGYTVTTVHIGGKKSKTTTKTTKKTADKKPAAKKEEPVPETKKEEPAPATPAKPKAEAKPAL